MDRSFVKFQIIFWLGAALLLFLYGLSYGHWEVALIRNLYFPIVGLLLSTAMSPIYKNEMFVGEQKSWILVVLTCGLAAIVTAAILNPITFALLGENLSVLPLKYFSTDTLYFCLFYFVWSMLFFERYKTKQKSEKFQNIKVESRGEIRTLNIGDVECVQSSGDYIELQTDKNNYLKKETLSSIEAKLPADKFKRIHRTTIVNLGAISSVTAKGRGIYEIKLISGRKVQSSRSYRDAIADTYPSA